MLKKSSVLMLQLTSIATVAWGNPTTPTTPAAGGPELSLSDLMSIQIVTASKEAEPINLAPGVISTLSRHEIDLLGPKTLLEILTTMPGIVASGSYLFDRSTLAVQGDMSKEGTGHVLLLINGRPIREVQQGGLSSEMLEGFPVSAIERIELIKGPGSVLYGSDAFTGVINIITRKPTEDQAKVTVMTTPSWGRRGDASVSMVQGDLSITQSATYNKPDMLEATYNYKGSKLVPAHPIPINFAPTSYGAHTQIDYREFSGMIGYAQTNSFSQVRGALNRSRQEKVYGNLGYNTTLTDIWSVSVNSGVTQAELKTDNFPNIERNSYEAMGEVTNFIKIGDGKAVVGGLVTHREGEESNWTVANNPGPSDFNGFSLYSQVSYPVIQPVQLIGGVQYNQVLDLKPALVPRAGAIWEITQELSLKALWSNAYRAPSINELSLNGSTIKGNSDLKPENIETYDLALSYNGNNIYSSANIFYSKMTDIIKANPTSTIIPGYGAMLKYQNSDNIQLMGAGAEIKGYITKAWLLSASANYQETFNDNDVWDLLPIPDYSGKLGVSYESPMGWDAGVSNIFLGNYHERFTTGLVNTAPTSSIQTDLNGRLSVGRWLNLKNKQDFSLRAQVRNLFDQTGTIPEWGGTTQDAIPNLTGRSYYLGTEMQI